MNYLKVITTGIGQIWLLQASENGLVPTNSEGKIDFQRRVIDLIVEEVLGDVRITRAENGAPAIESDENRHISISHSDDYFTVYISSVQVVGVDVEICKRNLEKGKHYFLNEHEIDQKWTNDELYQIWGMKEALFKEVKGEMEHLNLEVTTVQLSEKEVKCEFLGKHYSFGVERFDNVILVYSL